MNILSFLEIDISRIHRNMRGKFKYGGTSITSNFIGSRESRDQLAYAFFVCLFILYFAVCLILRTKPHCIVLVYDINKK